MCGVLWRGVVRRETSSRRRGRREEEAEEETEEDAEKEEEEEEEAMKRRQVAGAHVRGLGHVGSEIRFGMKVRTVSAGCAV